ncbi:hypothetical protein [Kitasatospora cinereorecta]|uniref:hypothetical protein n=1 Tax=Kitasatospora cinereorecta TaxID=285560 RepID=UPI0031F876E7
MTESGFCQGFPSGKGWSLSRQATERLWAGQSGDDLCKHWISHDLSAPKAGAGFSFVLYGRTGQFFFPKRTKNRRWGSFASLVACAMANFYRRNDPKTTFFC